MPNNFLFQLAKHTSHITGINAVGSICQFSNGLVTQGADAILASHLVYHLVSLTNTSSELVADSSCQCFISGRWLPIPCGLAGFSFQFVNGLDYYLHFLVGKQHATQHLVFSQLFGLRLNHQDGVCGTRNNHIKVRTGEGGITRIEHVTGFGKANAGGTNRAAERNTRQGQCR